MLRGFNDPDKFAQDLSFMTASDWRRFDIKYEERRRRTEARGVPGRKPSTGKRYLENTGTVSFG